MRDEGVAERRLEAARAGQGRARPRGRSFLGDLYRRSTATFAALILIVVAVTAIFSPLLAPFDPAAQHLSANLRPPLSAAPDGRLYLLGTDHLGRDLLSRIIFGSRVSLIIGVTAVVLSGGIGLLIGLIAGYFGGTVDFLCMRAVDFVLAFPFIIIALAFIAILGPSLPLIVIVIALRIWVIYARVVRAVTLQLCERDFVAASVAIGCSDVRVIFRHILPNVISPCIIVASLYLGRMIILESALSFLGLGVPPPTPTWGGILNAGKGYLYSSWWIATFPGLAIMLTALAASLLGDWVRDILDPRSKITV